MAGPLSPRWVNRMFSRKLSPLQRTTAATDVPDSSTHRSLSWSVMMKGTSPARVGRTSWPNWRAISYPKPVAPIVGMDRPPVAMTTDDAAISPMSVLRP